jgi:transcription elongation factor GreA
LFLIRGKVFAAPGLTVLRSSFVLFHPLIFVGEIVPTTDNDAVTWLTQDAYDRLSKELAELIAYRPLMAKEINDRREEGDLKENGGYHAAREEQGKQEARIAQLTVLLRGSREEGQTANIDVYSSASPLGKALTGASEGDTVSYDTPNGKTMKVTLIKAVPFTG